jgi:large subunit ribosomal protein L21
VNQVYAIISDGAHQYRVEEGQVFEVQRRDLPEDAKTVEFDRVLFVGDLEDGPKIGQPIVEGAKVTASVLGEVKAEKLVIQKIRRRKGYRLKKGHRQKHLQVKVDKIEV